MSGLLLSAGRDTGLQDDTPPTLADLKRRNDAKLDAMILPEMRRSPFSRCRSWSAVDEMRLIEARVCKVPRAQIAEEMGRSLTAVSARLALLRAEGRL